MTPAQWRLSRQVPVILAAEPGIGMTEQALAERLGVTSAVLHPVIGMLIGRSQVERCGDYLVVAGRQAQDIGGAA